MRNGVLGVIFVLFVIGVGIYSYLNQPVQLAEAELLNTMIVAFDYDGEHPDVTAARLLNGDAVIFLKKVAGKFFFFDTLDDLRLFDQNNDGFIDLNSEGYQNLYVGRYRKNRDVLTYHSFMDSGIAAIKLDYVQGRVISGKVILADSTHRQLDLVAINDNYLAEARVVKDPESDLFK